MKILCNLVILFLLLCTACSDYRHSYPGYIEGEYTYISTGVSGTLFNLYVERGQNVQKDTLLFDLDPQPEQANVAVTKANIASLQAQVVFAQLQLDRQKRLFSRNVTSASDLDQAQSEFDSRSQQLAANQAQLIQSTWSLQQKKVYSPVSGQVFDTFFRIGEKVVENKPVLAILAPKNINVLFYLPETQISQLKIGETVNFSCDGCKGMTKATVTYISPEAE